MNILCSRCVQIMVIYFIQPLFVHIMLNKCQGMTKLCSI